MARKLKPHVTKPEILAPASIHPAFNKAADYFGLTVVCAELNDAYEADVSKLEKVRYLFVMLELSRRGNDNDSDNNNGH